MYNVRDYIVACVDSIICQISEDVEIIVVDDCSIDGSLEVLQQYVENNNLESVQILTKENSGASASRNLGIENASGDFILFMDSDDVMTSDAFVYFEKCTNEMPNADLYIFSLKKKIDGVIEESMLSNIQSTNIRDGNSIDLLNSYLEHTKYIISWQPWSKIFRRDIIIKNNIRFDELLYCCNDFNFFFKYILYTHNLCFNNTPTTIYTVARPDCISLTETYKRILSMLSAYSFAFDSIDKYNGIKSSGFVRNVLGYISYLYLSGLELSSNINENELAEINMIVSRQKLIYHYSNSRQSKFKRLCYDLLGLKKGSQIIRFTRIIVQKFFFVNKISDI